MDGVDGDSPRLSPCGQDQDRRRNYQPVELPGRSHRLPVCLRLRREARSTRQCDLAWSLNRGSPGRFAHRE